MTANFEVFDAKLTKFIKLRPAPTDAERYAPWFEVTYDMMDEKAREIGIAKVLTLPLPKAEPVTQPVEVKKAEPAPAPVPEKKPEPEPAPEPKVEKTPAVQPQQQSQLTTELLLCSGLTPMEKKSVISEHLEAIRRVGYWKTKLNDGADLYYGAMLIIESLRLGADASSVQNYAMRGVKSFGESGDVFDLIDLIRHFSNVTKKRFVLVRDVMKILATYVSDHKDKWRAQEEEEAHRKAEQIRAAQEEDMRRANLNAKASTEAARKTKEAQESVEKEKGREAEISAIMQRAACLSVMTTPPEIPPSEKPVEAPKPEVAKPVSDGNAWQFSPYNMAPHLQCLKLRQTALKLMKSYPINAESFLEHPEEQFLNFKVRCEVHPEEAAALTKTAASIIKDPNSFADWLAASKAAKEKAREAEVVEPAAPVTPPIPEPKTAPVEAPKAASVATPEVTVKPATPEYTLTADDIPDFDDAPLFGSTDAARSVNDFEVKEPDDAPVASANEISHEENSAQDADLLAWQPNDGIKPTESMGTFVERVIATTQEAQKTGVKIPLRCLNGAKTDEVKDKFWNAIFKHNLKWRFDFIAAEGRPLIIRFSGDGWTTAPSAPVKDPAEAAPKPVKDLATELRESFESALAKGETSLNLDYPDAEIMKAIDKLREDSRFANIEAAVDRGFICLQLVRGNVPAENGVLL